MKKIILWIYDNLLFLATLFLLAFIPLYPKVPLVDIRNTWVYIRAEDFVVLLFLMIWIFYLVKHKITLKTPLTLPIIAFWLVGALATIHGIILLFPNSANVFPNVAFLSYLRHIEYFSVFFIAFAGMRHKKFLKYVVISLILTLVGVIVYGFGQKYLAFPAYLTMNEEFAKGIPIQLSQFSRVPSTFAGHYDLAAYLVLVIPIVISLIFGIRNWIIKIVLAGISFAATVLMLMTVSRVSFFVLFIALLIVLFFHKRRFVLYSIPVFIIAGFIFISFQSSLFDRFTNTISEVNVLIDSKTGAAIGHVKYVDRQYFDDKAIRLTSVRDTEQLAQTLGGDLDAVSEATPSSLLDEDLFPERIPLVMDVNVSTGESLPQGTGYVNLALSPVTQELGSFFYEFTQKDGESSSEAIIIYGDFLVKRVAAYDLSFTTRFQGEWPNAIEAFEKNIFLGSGYGSVSLAIDNNYLRILAETGLFGFSAFIAIFLAFGIYVKKSFSSIDSRLARSFVLGVGAGVIGLSLNATLIDVFEASKVAFVLWLLIGVTVGLLSFYSNKTIDMAYELRKALFSSPAIILYIGILIFAVYSPALSNYFTGDDFTWFRWAADCSVYANQKCPTFYQRAIAYFTQADGFFYRPGTKFYFTSFYSLFWMNQVVFHIVSLVLHFSSVVIFYLLARKLFKSNGLAAIGSFIFIFMSGYAEVIFWISAVGHLFTALFVLLSIYLFSLWIDKKNYLYLSLSAISIFVGVLFHEMGVVAPFLIILYQYALNKDFSFKRFLKTWSNLIILLPVLAYLPLRFFAQSHWSGGDYSYNLVKLPLNIIGNAFGYLLVILTGNSSLGIYDSFRNIFRENIALSVFVMSILFVALIVIFRIYYKKINGNDRRIIIFGILFFVISLLPFLPLGNIAMRYTYLASFGVIILILLIIKKIYNSILEFGKEIALGGIGVALCAFMLLHIIQVQQLQKDWTRAGEMVKRFFISVDSTYTNAWSKPDSELYFVNVPIKHNDAWVFPVGLEDAVWLAFRNDGLRVQKYNNLNDALRVVGFDTNKWVLLFNDDGGVSEVIRYKDPKSGEMKTRIREK